MNDSTSGIGRTAQILQFLLKYRSAGVFTGLDLDAATLEPDDRRRPKASPRNSSHDLEALGPTFIKIGQALSTRPDMVPAPYLAALERMQDERGAGAVRSDPRQWSRIAARRAHQPRVRARSTKCRSAAPRWRRCIARRCATAAPWRSRCSGRASPKRSATDLDALTRLAGHADRMTDLGRRVRFADWVHEFRKALTGRARLPGRSREPRALRRALRGLSRTVRAGAGLGPYPRCAC